MGNTSASILSDECSTDAYPCQLFIVGGGCDVLTMYNINDV